MPATAELFNLGQNRTDIPEEFDVDEENCIIYGCKLGDQQSKNNRRFTEDSIADMIRLANNAPVSTVPHGSESARAMNGQIRNPRRRADGKPIGDWHLEKSDPYTKKWLESAKRFPGNIALSVDCPWKEVEKQRLENGTVQVNRIHVVDWFTLTHDGGSNNSLHESRKTRRKKMRKTPARKKPDTPHRLIESYSDLPEPVRRFIESTTAEAEVNDELAKAMQKEVDDLKTKNKELQKELKQYQDKAALQERKEKLQGQFHKLTKDLDPKAVAEIALKDEDLTKLVEMDPADAAIDIAERVSKLAKSLQESNSSNKDRFYIQDRPAKSKSEDSELDLVDDEFGDFVSTMTS